ncbi:UBS3A protein, partial [Baryphthengus martii]|nr:UBS3A protein [Baryphthengus martii]
QTLRVLFQYKPQNIDELMINAGDFIYVDPTQQSDVSEGWVIGTSHRTGCRGFLPENYTERANESDTWVKHREYVFVTTPRFFTQTENRPNEKLNGEVHNPSVSRSVTDVLSLQTATLQRGVLVMRHGERVDQVFGKSWLQQCFTADGKYHRADLNFPSTLPKRKDGVKHFEYDPPLSCCGIFQSRLIGEALLDQEATVSYVYSSPALCCIQTAQHVLQGLKLDQKVKIRVEPGLFEWTKWETNRGIPSFMTVTEMAEASYKIDTSYRASYPPGDEYGEPDSPAVLLLLFFAFSGVLGVILIVGHGSSLVSFTRPLIGLPARDSSDFVQAVRKIPLLGMCFCEELKEENKWHMVNPPVKTLTHGANASFNWRNSIVED